MRSESDRKANEMVLITLLYVIKQHNSYHSLKMFITVMISLASVKSSRTRTDSKLYRYSISHSHFI